MKTTRVFASACLLVSSVALLTAASISVGDEPGVVRLSSLNPQTGGAGTGVVPAPVPDQMGQMGGTGVVYGDPSGPMPYPQPSNYAPYFERSLGATQAVPSQAYQPQQPFGPVLMFESNIDDGLGYAKGYHRLNARIPYHVLPNTTVMIGDLSAAVTNDGSPLYNYGLVYRNYDEALNRIFGWNVFGDYDQGYGNTEWHRMTFGLESLGKYIDWRANGYFVLGNDTMLLSDQLTGDLSLAGNNVFRLHQQVRENAYSGFDIEAGGPLPLLGRYGLNMYLGGYYLNNDNSEDTVGFQARWEALITESVTVNTFLTTDDTFGTNSWVSMQYSIPNYKNKRILRPSGVRERLQDPVIRQNRVHAHIDESIVPEAIVNADKNRPYFLMYVDPNASANGNGTFENPFRTLQQAENANSALVDIIRVTPRSDDTNTNLTVNGGLNLFDCQILLSSTRDFNLFTEGTRDFIIPGTPTPSNLGPLISNPTMVAGGSVVHLANQNQIIGMRIDGANAAGTVFGNGVSNALPIEDVTLQGNTFTNYTVGANLNDVSGLAIIDSNTFTGRTANSVSQTGLLFTTAAGQTVDLLVQNNRATGNASGGLVITAKTGSTINADNPDAFGTGTNIPATGIIDNVVTGNGVLAANGTVSSAADGISLTGEAGSTINAVVEGNISSNNTGNGFLGETDGGVFNLFSMQENSFVSNRANGAFLHYLNGGTFEAISEDLDRDGLLDAGEDLNGNGRMDQGIVSNSFVGNSVAGLCIFGEDSGDGNFDIGGDVPTLGNLFAANLGGGIAVDLNGTATGSLNIVNNRIFGFGEPTAGDVLRTGFSQNTLAANDDLFTGLINTGFTMNFFGQIFNDLTVNNNGNVSFAGPLATFTPFPLLTTATPMIAPFFADVDTRLGNTVTFGTGTIDGQNAFGVNYNDVRHFSVFGANQGLPTNDFQLVLVDRSDVSPGDFDIEFNYSQIQWEAGEASGSNAQGLGGSTARVGWTNGVDRAFELPGSGIPGSFLDSGPAATSLVQNSLNSGVLGRYVFESRNGSITSGAAINGADGIAVRLSDDAVLNSSRIINNTITQSRNNGVSLAATDNAVASSVVVQGNNISRSRLNGLTMTADGPNARINTATIGGLQNNTLNGTSFAQGNTIRDNGTSGTGDGVQFVARNGSLIRGSVQGNTVSENTGDGVALLVDNGGELDFGTPASGRIISGNTVSDNDGAGIRLVSNVSATTEGLINAAIQGNTVSGNGGGGIVANLNGPNNVPPALPLVVENNVLNLSIGGTTVPSINTISGNADVGIGVQVTGNGRATVDIRNTSITDTTDGADPALNGDGINLRRADTSLLTATIEDVTATGNAGDGLDVDVQGNDKNDPDQPASGTVNMVTWNRNNLSNNGQNGARFRTRGDSMLIADGQSNTLNGNGQNGILVQTSENSNFGDATDGLPPGRRVQFDGNTIEDNGVDGVQIVATEDSRALVEITSTRIPAASGAHAALNSRGDTSISRNGGDGVGIETTGGRSDILITSGTGQTTINGNGTGAGGGNGIRWDASGTSDATVRVTRTNITNSIAGATEDLNGNGILDPGEDLNSNNDIDVANGDGIQANFSNNATSTLVVGNVGEGNRIQSNEDDGIAITATGSNATGNPQPIISIVDNTIGGENNGISAGNGGDGLSVNIFGGTAVGVAPGNVDFTLPVLTFNGGVTESGPIPNISVTGNLISQNNRKGANILLTGAAGLRDREDGAFNAADDLDLVQITFDDNTIVSNGEEGIYYRADANMNQSRFVYLANFPDPPFTGNDRPLNGASYDPTLPEFTFLNAGTVNGNTAYIAPYLNLRTVQNSFLTIVNNTIQNNGTNTVTGEGIRVDVGTGAYVAADIRNNTMGGNLEEDFVTSSFLSAGETFTSQDNNGDLTFDFVYLDDTAQFDLRFQNNSGNQIDPSALGATYTTLDPLKALFLGNIGAQNRNAFLFQVENGANLNNPNNSFINFGITQSVTGAFATGGYNIRAAADPLFPNIGFAPFLP